MSEEYYKAIPVWSVTRGDQDIVMEQMRFLESVRHNLTVFLIMPLHLPYPVSNSVVSGALELLHSTERKGFNSIWTRQFLFLFVDILLFFQLNVVCNDFFCFCRSNDEPLFTYRTREHRISFTDLCLVYSTHLLFALRHSFVVFFFFFGRVHTDVRCNKKQKAN